MCGRQTRNLKLADGVWTGGPHTPEYGEYRTLCEHKGGDHPQFCRAQEDFPEEVTTQPRPQR